MQKEQLQQNVKDKVKVFEDGGIRLLKKWGHCSACCAGSAGCCRTIWAAHCWSRRP